MFQIIKKRLKTLLKSEFLYTDGLTVQQLNSFIKSRPTIEHFFENDLTKQDRQTDD